MICVAAAYWPTYSYAKAQADNYKLKAPVIRKMKHYKTIIMQIVVARLFFFCGKTYLLIDTAIKSSSVKIS